MRFLITLSMVLILSSCSSSLIPKDFKLKKVASNLRWGEGPVYQASTKSFLFADIPNGKVYSWNEKDGLKVFREKAGGANGHIIGQDGSVLSCD